MAVACSSLVSEVEVFVKFNFLFFHFSFSYGFKFSEHPLVYISFLVITIPHMLLVTISFYGIEIFFINILVFCTSYMKYVQCEIDCLKDDFRNLLDVKDAIRKRLCKIVEIHNKGIELAEKLENVLNLLMLTLYTVNTMVLCFLFFEFHIVSSFYFQKSFKDFYQVVILAFERLCKLAESFDFLRRRSDSSSLVLLLWNKTDGGGSFS